MKKRKQFFVLILLLAVGLVVTDRLILQKRGVASFEGAVETSAKERYFDLSELSSEQFQVAYKQALIQGLHVEKKPTSVHVSWGQFLVRNASGGKVYACEKYPVIEMTLQAEGVAYAGEVPTLTLRMPCVSSDDGQSILPFPIPLIDLHAHLLAGVYKVPANVRDEMTMSAQTLYNEWPRYWNVVNVKLESETGSLELDGYEIISLLDRPLTLDFAEGQ